MTSHNSNYDSLTRSLEAEVEFLDLFLDISCSAVPFYFAHAGVLFDSANFLGHFLCSVEGEKHDGINDVG